MLSISHTLTGVFIASQLPHPAVYIPLTLGSHYLEDWIPHWDVGTGLSSGKRKRSTAIIMEIGELIISVGLVFWWFQAFQPTIQWHVWIAFVVSLIPDFLEAPRNFLKFEPWFLKPLNNFHNLFHNSTPNMFVGLTPQILLWIFIWWYR